ncbi:MAG TPA: tagatose 1,6-diphosphate aldolase [Candidatus Limnocylindrales bacterium]
MTVGRAALGETDTSAIGRRRRLLRLAGSEGIVAGIAMDHRDSLRVTLERRGIGPLSTPELRRQKLALARALAPSATAVMIDAELGSLALEEGAIPADIGLIMPLEAQGYEAGGDRRRTTLLDDFSPRDALARGADACKILLPYRPDDRDLADDQDDVVRAAVADFHALGLPLVVEPIVYRLETETEAAFAAAYSALVIAAVTRVRGLGVDLLKLPFPTLDATPDAATGASAHAACAALADACRDTPWVLLGAGAPPDAFVAQIRTAGAAGASGFLAGRGIWGPALRADAAETERVAATVARPVLEQCRAAAVAVCRPLTLAQPA